MDTLLEQLTALADEAAHTAGCELVDLEVSRGKASWVVRVFIDKPSTPSVNDPGGLAEIIIPPGVTIQECGQVSNMLSSLLDVNDPIPGQYHLEVSSPGALRPLKKKEDFQRFIGRMAAVYTVAPRDPVDGRRRFQGKILGVAGDTIQLDVDGESLSFDWETIARSHLELDMSGKGLKARGGQSANKKHQAMRSKEKSG